ncbi:MAG: hypothetical protein ACSHX0_05665 [Akkermansiaceae bacterium]
MNRPLHQQVTVSLPYSDYQLLRTEAKKRRVSLAKLIQQKMTHKLSKSTVLSSLPLEEIIRRTTPPSLTHDSNASMDLFTDRL